MSDPTIRLSSCRGDGRCPECGEGSAFPFRLLCGCSPCLSSACSLNHTRALLTEALRRNSNEYMRGVEAVLRIRCMKHRLVPELNSVVHGGGECAVCAVENLREERDAAIRQVEEQRHPCPCGKDTASIKWARCYSCRQRDTEELEVMREERDAAIRENVAADQRGWERAISAVRFALADYPHAGLDSEIGAQVERIVAEKTESAIRERDEARVTGARQALRIQQQEAAWNASQERSDRAEALLRVVLDSAPISTVSPLLAKIREALQ